MTDVKKSALEVLEKHYEDTKFDFFLKKTLMEETGITDAELYELHNEGIISRTQNINKQTLIILRKYVNFLERLCLLLSK